MKKLFTTGLLLLLLQMTYAQNMSSVIIKKLRQNPVFAIKQGTDVKGYYLFYVSDKINKSTNEYTLRIMDENLKSLKEIKFQGEKDMSILESSFNGTDLMFLFYNQKERTFEYQVYGADGKKKAFTYSRELSKKEVNYLAIMYNIDDEESTYQGLYPIENKGFISIMPSREDKDFTFQADFFASDKRKQWSYIPTEGAKRFIADYLGTFNNVVYLEVLKTSGTFDQKPDSYILGLDLETGKKLFEFQTDKKFRMYPASLSVIGNKAIIYGEFFDLDGNVFKDKSKGFAFWGIDEKGKITSEKYCSWAMEMGKYMNVSSSGKIDDFGFMCLHNIIQTANGDIYAIGEGFKKTADALGIAAQMMGGKASVTKLVITDMLLIKFDQNFNVKEAKFYDKAKSSFNIPGSALYGAPAIAKLVKSMGGFDYAYTQTNADVSSFSVCYADYEKDKDYKGATFNSISYNDGKITTDKIQTKSKATYTWVRPAKQGQVLIIEYFKKDDRLEARFEKLN